MKLEIEESNDLEKYYDEVLCIHNYYKKFLKNSRKPVSSYTKNMRNIILFLAFVITYFVVSGIFIYHGLDTLTVVVIAMFSILLLLAVYLYLIGKKNIKIMKNNTTKRVITFSDEGFELVADSLDNSMHTDIKFTWDDIRFIKVNSSSIAIFTKVERMPYIMFSRNNLNKFKEILNYYKKDNLIVK